MKRLLYLAFLLMSLMITSAALAADISLVDNEDFTGTIMYTADAGEVIRGLSIIIEAGGGSAIDAVTNVNPQFNVFVDFDMPGGGGYNIGDDPDGPGAIDLPASKITLSMGILDMSGGQAGAFDNGTYELATLLLSDSCNVTIAPDVLRGGIVGDNITAGTIEGGFVTPEPISIALLGLGGLFLRRRSK